MNLISKKELLALTGISYGQLYRWKREKLIPEEWFIKQSSYTGQETFFPREQILSRVRSILDYKDQYTLEELARMFSPQAPSLTVPMDRLSGIEELSRRLLPSFLGILNRETFDFHEVVMLAFVSESAEELGLDDGQTVQLLSKVFDENETLRQLDSFCTVFLTGGECHLAVTRSFNPIRFDSDVRSSRCHALSELAGRLKMKYQDQLFHRV